MQKITLFTEDQHEYEYDFYNLPDVCPYCGKGIIPKPIHGYFQNVTDPGLNRHQVQVVFQCPISSCRALFVTQYDNSHDDFFIRRDLYKTFEEHKFGNETSEISPDFVSIYNNTYLAEQMGLSLIIGPGYRKALEFLIKDYVIKKISSQDEIENVRKAFLGSVIENYINDDRIKSTAIRAAWLGNDETHYVRKWVDKDIEDLKQLIEMTTNWIQLVELSKKIESEMPK
jgi:hypothetical protein